MFCLSCRLTVSRKAPDRHTSDQAINERSGEMMLKIYKN
jgi:hypothetical protein